MATERRSWIDHSVTPPSEQPMTPCPDCDGVGSLPVRALDPRPARPCGRCDTTGRVPADELVDDTERGL